MMEGPVKMKYEVEGFMMGRGDSMRKEQAEMKGGFL
jgi:hypothetical protein